MDEAKMAWDLVLIILIGILKSIGFNTKITVYEYLVFDCKNDYAKNCLIFNPLGVSIE